MDNLIIKSIDNHFKLEEFARNKLPEKIREASSLLLNALSEDKKIMWCGNGGSAGNANHIANDLLYAAGKKNKKGINVESLSANPSVITCLANDTGYENIFSEQLKVKGRKGDLLIVLSGSGNSLNIVNAIKVAKRKKLDTFAILGFNGGKCKKIINNFIHFNVNDMQISEDLQMIVLNICIQKLMKTKLSR